MSLEPTAGEAAPLPRAEIDGRVHSELGLRVIGWTELGTGTNNRLFRLDTAEERPLLAKLYARDRWNRLGTEYPALTLLAERGVAGVPRPFLRSDDRLYAVCSFEPGERKTPVELDEADARAAAGWLADLHAFGPHDVPDALPPANPACFSPADHVALVDQRLTGFEAALADPHCRDDVRAFADQVDVRAAVAAILARVTAGMAPDELSRPLPRAAWRLNTGDFGPHNLLFADGRLTVVDFEGAGWDDPARVVMGFVAHGGSDGLPPASADAFLAAYAERRGLSASDRARYEQVGALLDADWAAVYAAAITPEAMEPKRFATPDFDPAAHVAFCLDRLRERLERAERGGRRFPPGCG